MTSSESWLSQLALLLLRGTPDAEAALRKASVDVRRVGALHELVHPSRTEFGIAATFGAVWRGRVDERSVPSDHVFTAPHDNNDSCSVSLQLVRTGPLRWRRARSRRRRRAAAAAVAAVARADGAARQRERRRRVAPAAALRNVGPARGALSAAARRAALSRARRSCSRSCTRARRSARAP